MSIRRAAVVLFMCCVFGLVSQGNSSSSDFSSKDLPTYYYASEEMLYYPTEEDFLDEELVNRPALDPKKKTEKDLINDYISWICEGRSKVTPELIQSVVMSESSYNPKARNGSHVGLMQVSTKWHKARAERLGVVDLYDPYGNLLVGIDYLEELIEQTDGDIGWALMIYNMGHTLAYQYHQQGVVSSYASGIIARL